MSDAASATIHLNSFCNDQPIKICSCCSPKNYQLWYHRRALLEFRFIGKCDVLHVAKKELDYVDKILDDDSKNYHVSHFVLSSVMRLLKSQI